MMTPKIKKISIIILLVIMFLITLYLDTYAGYKDSGISLFLKSFAHLNNEDITILEVLRYPRVLKVIIAGVSLALAGLFMQTVSKNPLAEPYITGISSGAGLGIVLSIIYFNGVNYSLFGFVGALISSFTVICFAGLRGLSMTKLILTGMSLNLFVSSLISLFILMHADKSHLLMFILSGGFNSNDIISDKGLCILFLAGLCASAFLIPKLNFLRLDGNIIASFKKQKDIYIILMIMTSAFLASVSVFASGILGFIGIIAPQISRMLVGSDYRYLFFTNIFLGSSFILLADYISRTAIYPMQIPLGLIIALLGAPIFIFFLTKKGGIFNNDKN